MRNARLLLMPLLLLACEPARPSDILDDRALQDLLSDARNQIERSGLPQGESDALVALCTYPWMQDGFGEQLDYGAAHSSDPIWMAPNLVGTWDSAGCLKYAQDGQVPAHFECTQTITYSDQHDGRISQVYDIDTSGSGIGFISATEPDGAAIIQTNSAHGSGCSQEIVNLINVWPSGTYYRDGVPVPNTRRVLVFNAILSSTCGGPRWQCVEMGWFRR